MLKVRLSGLILFLFAFALGSNAFASGGAFGNTDAKVLSFKVWKQKKTDEALANVAEIKREIKKSNDRSDDFKTGLNQAEINLKVAHELSANDYFVLYLTPQFHGSREALIQASKHLSAKDFADILAAYQKTLESGEVLSSKSAPSNYEDPL